jgi:two-component system, response regulator
MIEYPVRPTRSVLVVDDSEDDVLLLSITLQHARVPWTIVAALPDGDRAIQWLQRSYHTHSSPMHKLDLLLIDLKMPRRNGFDVLRWVQKNLPRRFTTAVFSSSFAVADITRAREFGADFYFAKPVMSDERKKILINLERMLASNATSPVRNDGHFDTIINSALQL